MVRYEKPKIEPYRGWKTNILIQIEFPFINTTTHLPNIVPFSKTFLIFLLFGSNLSLFPETGLSEKHLSISVQ